MLLTDLSAGQAEARISFLGADSPPYTQMQIDWQRAINDILASKLSCPRCGALVEEVMIGYLRTAEVADHNIT